MHGGIHYKSNKFLTSGMAIKELQSFKVHKFDLRGYGDNSFALPMVKVGEYVKMGQLIAAENKKYSVNVHSSVSGKVLAVDEDSIDIENDFKDDYTGGYIKIEKPTSEQILERIREAGIVGMGGGGFPTHIKYETDKQINTLIINGAECEDYLTVDQRLMREQSRKILLGAKMLAKIKNICNIIVAVEKDKYDAVKAMKESAYTLNASEIEEEQTLIKVVTIVNKYPMGAEKILIKTLTDKDVPMGMYSSDIGIIVNNVQTALAVYYAVAEGEPCIKRVITVSGRSIICTGNYLVRLGSSVNDILSALNGLKYDSAKFSEYKEYAKVQFANCQNIAYKMHDADNKEDKKKFALELKKEIKRTNKDVFAHYKIATIGSEFELKKILNGGSFMGSEIDTQYCITKKTSAILFLSVKEAVEYKELPCIHCRRCAKVCPVRIVPIAIRTQYDMKNYDECKKLNAQTCIECGCCSLVCPVNIKLTESVHRAKTAIKYIKEKDTI